MNTKLSKEELLKLWVMKNSGNLARAMLDRRFIVFTDYPRKIEEMIVNYLFDQEEVAAVETTGIGICVYPVKV